jgi:hypothetical protein
MYVYLVFIYYSKAPMSMLRVPGDSYADALGRVEPGGDVAKIEMVCCGAEACSAMG